MCESIISQPYLSQPSSNILYHLDSRFLVPTEYLKNKNVRHLTYLLKQRAHYNYKPTHDTTFGEYPTLYRIHAHGLQSHVGRSLHVRYRTRIYWLLFLVSVSTYFMIHTLPPHLLTPTHYTYSPNGRSENSVRSCLLPTL